jgi:hypothetical protein
MDTVAWRESASNAFHFWEIRRLIYNLALAAIVLAVFLSRLPASRSQLSLNFVLVMFLLAVLANIAYSVVYLLEILAQAAGYRDPWLRARPIVFAIGCLFAATLTYFWSHAILGSGY